MSRRGGYKQNDEGIEWARVHEVSDAQGKLSAAGMGQSYYTWLNDAIAFHVHYCERYQLHQQYRHDQQEAAAQSRPTVSPHDAQYQPRSPKPSLTLPAAGQGSTAGRSPSLIR